jgi:hypothetical protein
MNSLPKLRRSDIGSWAIRRSPNHVYFVGASGLASSGDRGADCQGFRGVTRHDLNIPR